MCELLTPNGLHQLIQGKAITSSQRQVADGLELSRFQYEPWAGFLPPLRDHLLIAYHWSTRVSQQIDGRRRSGIVPSGGCTLLNQATATHWQWAGPIDNTVIHISSKLLSKIAAEAFDRDIQDVPIFNTLKLRDPILENIVLSLEQEASNPGLGSNLYIEALTNQLCVHILRKHASVTFSPMQIKGGLSPLLAKRVADYIQSNLESTLSLNDLADIVKVSPYHFARQFKLRFGCPPHAYVMMLRLAHARKLLASTRLMLKEIAAICGFSDQAHMTRLFKRKFNSTPSEFRAGILHDRRSTSAADARLD